ncbi:MAG: ATP-binding protein [Clostridia bacterium]|nr:ATP-binding protein [Clostridia bacterium]
MIHKLIKQMLAAQIFSALTVSVCLLIDNVMIGRFLGEEAIAAYGLANPMLLAVGAVASLLSAGVQVVCSRYLGMGQQEEANRGYSSAVAIAAVISVSSMALILIFRTPLTRLLGAGSEGTLFDETRGYLTGFCPAAPASMGALILVPFLQMAGKSGLLIAAVLTMTVADIGLDLLNVLVLHWGMFGMGLASTVSYYMALIIGGVYFLSPRSVFRFSVKAVRKSMIRELFAAGVPAGFNMLSSVLLVFLMNQVMKGIGGSAAVAAFAVGSSIGGAANCITTGIGGVSLTLSSVFYHEEDGISLKMLLKLLCRYGIALGAGMTALIWLLAPALVSLFIPNPGTTQETAVLILRLFGLGIVPCAINGAVKNAWQGAGQIRLMELFSVLEGALLSVAAGFLLSRVMGLRGACLYFLGGEILALLFVILYVRKKTGRMPWQEGAALLLKPDFGATGGQETEMNLHDIREVTEASRKAKTFCEQGGAKGLTGSRVALCIEEIAGNTVQHGFRAGKKNILSIRLARKEQRWILRFRDDCGAFDPLHYVPAEGKDGLGLKLVMGMVTDAYYTYSMNMNNLVLILDEHKA